MYVHYISLLQLPVYENWQVGLDPVMKDTYINEIKVPFNLSANKHVRI